jgi:formylglycine-generating enzyme required for sulfatase activity
MVRVPAGEFQMGGSPPVHLADYWIDKYEVTNRQFKDFMDRGGYQNRQYWKQPLVDHGRAISWEEATLKFRDATGRPGPSTWDLGAYPDGQADFPVSGVSWYEAAAYAEFAKSIADGTSMVQRRRGGHLLRHPEIQQLRSQRRGACRQLSRDGAVRDL